MNRISKITAVLLLGTTITLFAADVTVETKMDTTVTVQVDIDTQIEQIKNADPQKRRELMNQFKKKLATVNREERMEAISKLRESMHAMNAEQMSEHANEHAKNGIEHMGKNMESMKGMAEVQQTMEMQHREGTEQMHQQQAVDQYMHSGAGEMSGSGGMNIPFGGQ